MFTIRNAEICSLRDINWPSNLVISHFLNLLIFQLVFYKQVNLSKILRVPLYKECIWSVLVIF